MVYTNLTFHRIRVDLAHVLSPVLLLDVVDVQVPRGHVVVCDSYPRVVSDDVVVDRLDGLSVGLHPTHLRRRIYVCQTVGTDCLLCSPSSGRPSAAAVDHPRKSAGNKANEISIQSFGDIEKPDAACG